jgi:competence protein ComEC
MTLGFLGLCLGSGMLWADAGQASLPSAVRMAVLLCAVALVVGCVTGRLASGAVWVVVAGPLIAGVIAFDAGSVRLESRLAEARRDRGRAEAAATAGIRRVEARVAARHARRFGDEVELDQMRAVDAGDPVPERALLRLPEATRAQPGRAQSRLWPGVRVRLALRITPLYSLRNPGAFDREHAESRRGFAARARLVDPDWVVVRPGTGVLHGPSLASESQARTAIRGRLAAGLVAAGDASGLVRALALGDRSGLSKALDEDFRRLGLSHLLAVSGLHVGMLAVLLGSLAVRGIGLLCPRCRDPFSWAIAIAVVGAGGYAWLVGGSVSVERAWCVLLIGGGLLLLRRAPRPVEILAAIALAMWIDEPASFFDLGAGLSFAACFGLVAAGIWGREHREHREHRDHRDHRERGERCKQRDTFGESISVAAGRVLGHVLRGLGSSLRVSCAAGFGTAVVLAHRGLPTAWVGPLVNAVAVPWTALLALPGALLAALGVAVKEAWTAVCCGGLAGDAARVAGSTIGLSGLGILVWPAEALARRVGWAASNLLLATPPELGMPLAVGLVSVLGLASLRFGWFATAALCWALLAVLGGEPRADHGPFAETPRVWFFDVGQGDAALIQGRERTILIDSGPGPADGSGGAALVDALHRLGIRSIDLFVVTHADLDHRGGALAVLDDLDVDELWLPESARGDPALEALAKQARERGGSVRWQTSATSPTSLGDLEVAVLWPPADARLRSRNAGSLVLRVEAGTRSFLFLADIDSGIEAELVTRRPERVRADYLKVSHHGSRAGTSNAFLEAVAPRHAIVSGPCLRTRGLPNSATLDRIRAAPGVRLWWTGRDGAIAVFPERSEAFDEVVAWGSVRDCPEG